MTKIDFSDTEENNVKTVTNKSFVGILWKGIVKTKSIVIREKDGFTYLHNWKNSTVYIGKAKSMRKLIKHTKKVDGHFIEAIKFDSYKEMLEWFSK